MRLQRDARYPWLVLVPRGAGLVELDALESEDLKRLAQETAAASRALRAAAAERGLLVEKINVAALGNHVPQLHVHVVGRRAGDEAWPEPVWGRGAPRPYAPAALEAMAAAVRRALEAAPR